MVPPLSPGATSSEHCPLAKSTLWDTESSLTKTSTFSVASISTVLGCRPGRSERDRGRVEESGSVRSEDERNKRRNRREGCEKGQEAPHAAVIRPNATSVTPSSDIPTTGATEGHLLWRRFNGLIPNCRSIKPTTISGVMTQAYSPSRAAGRVVERPRVLAV